jgi:serine/threonine protein kinase
MATEMKRISVLKNIKTSKTARISLCKYGDVKAVFKEKTIFPFTNDVASEVEIYAKLLSKNLSPKILDYDAALHSITFEYLEGSNDLINYDELFLTKLGKAIKKLHLMDFNDIGVESFQQKIDTYRQIFVDSDDSRILAGFELFDRLYDSSNKLVFCHNDINASNIFYTNDIKLIDWEYAGANLPVYDIASIIKSLKLDEYQTQILLDSYGMKLDVTKIKSFELLISHVEYIWQKALNHLIN